MRFLWPDGPEQATKIGLIINMKTAKALGIEFPTGLLRSARHGTSQARFATASAQARASATINDLRVDGASTLAEEDAKRSSRERETLEAVKARPAND
jgi:hypothetical protein